MGKKKNSKQRSATGGASLPSRIYLEIRNVIRLGDECRPAKKGSLQISRAGVGGKAARSRKCRSRRSRKGRNCRSYCAGSLLPSFGLRNSRRSQDKFRTA